jgi:hypothetical protein
MLEPPSSTRAFARAARFRLKPVAHLAGDFKDQTSVIGSQAQQLTLFVAKMGGQCHSDAVADQTVRLARKEALGRRLEDEAEEIQRFRVA